MSRTYLRAAATLVAGLLGSALNPTAELQARALFDSKPLPQERFAVLARPVGRDNWKLLVLEQIKQRPRCWTPRPDGLIDPTLNTFNFAGICSRYLDSNGYSLRSGGQDLANRFRLRLVAKGRNLHLEAMDPDQAIPLTIGRATIPARDRNGFVLIRLDSGWQLRRRVYKGRTLNHVYFANPTPVNQLLAQAGTSSRSAGFARLGLPAPPQQPGSGPGGNRPIRLEVIPYRP